MSYTARDFKMQKYFQDRLIFVSASIAMVINIILWLVAWGKFGYLGERLPLHFNIVYGIDFVASSRNIYQIPAAGLVVLILNLSLGKIVHPLEKFLSYLLVFGAALVQILLLFCLISLVVLNA